jgi:ankyrin repeat protein
MRLETIKFLSKPFSRREENDNTIPLLEKMDTITNIHLAPKKPVLETVVEISRSHNLQEKTGLTDIESLFLKQLYTKNLEKIKDNDNPESIARLENLNDSIRKRVAGDKSVFVPGLEQIDTLIREMFPELSLHKADGSYTYAGILGDAWNAVSNATSRAAEYVFDRVSSSVSSFASSEAWSGFRDGVRDAVYGTDSYRSSSSKSLSGSSNSSSTSNVDRIRNAYDTAKSVVRDISYGADYATGYTGGSALKSGAAALGNFLSGRSSDTKSLPAAPQSYAKDDKSRTLDLSRNDRDSYYWDDYDYSSSNTKLSESISSTDKDALKKFFNDEALKLKNADSLNNYSISAENLITILEMKKDDKEFISYLAELIEKAIKEKTNDSLILDLLDKGFPRSFKFKDENNLLHLALKYSNDTVLNKLKEEDLSVFNTINHEGISPAHVIALQARADFFHLDKGLDFNLAAKDGLTPLQALASFTDNADALSSLLKNKNIEINKVDNDGNTALLKALFNFKRLNNLDSIKVLLENQAQPNLKNKEEMGAIHVTALNNSEALADLIINNPDTDINLASKDGVTALYMTAKREYDSDNVARALLNRGAKLEFKNLSSPLILAALEDAHKVTDLLLERGLRLNNEELKDLSDFYSVIGDNNQSMKKVLEAHSLNLASHELYKEDKVNSSLQRLEKAGALTKAESHRWDSVLRIIESGNVNILKYYASSNALLDMKGEKALNAFHIAVESAQPQMISALIGLGLGEYINVKNTDDKTALIRAAEKGDLDSFKALLKAKADLKLTDKEGNTAIKLIEQPLTEIIKEKKLTEEDLKLLLDNGLNPNLEDKHGNNLVHLISKYGNETMLEIAFQAGADIHKRNNKKQTAFNTHSENIEHGQAIKNKLNFLALIEKDADGNNVLHHAAAVNNLAAIKELVNSGMNINEKNNNDETAFHTAAKHGQAEALKTLKDLGADVNMKNTDSWTPAHYAAAYGHSEALKVLKELGADINTQDCMNLTPIHYATEYGQAEVLKTLKKLGVDINREEKSTGLTLAHIAAQHGQSEVLRTLKELGINLNNKNSKNIAPVHTAARYEQSEVLKTLKDLGVDLNVRDSNGWNPSHIAARYGQPEVLKTLKELGVDINREENSNGLTPAHIAAQHGQSEILRTLKELGVNLDNKNSKNRAPIHTAAFHRQLEILRTLKELGANLNNSSNGWTAANIASQNYDDEISKTLKELGADSSDYMQHNPSISSILISNLVS